MKKNLDDKELDVVTGGDYGDSKMEFSDTPEGVRFLYNVGDHVEVFQDGTIHIHTYGATIIERRVANISDRCTTHYYGEYNVKYDKNGATYWVDADRIER